MPSTRSSRPLPAAYALALALTFGAAPARAGTPFVINEVDADQTGTDAAEFAEIYDGGAGNSSLTGYVLVLFNGGLANDGSYLAFDLDGQSTDANGYFVLCGNNLTVANCDLDVAPNTDLIQNGQDAVALYLDDATSFPNGTAPTITNLVDALVYDTSDADDPGLLILLNAGQPQVDENANGAGITESNQRCPDGSGGQRNTITYDQFPPTPGVANTCGGGGVTLSIDDVSQVEGDAGTSSFVFTVTLSAPAPTGGVVFDLATADGTAQDGNPVTEDDDYVGFTLPGNSIAEGNTTFQFNVTVNGDLDAEPDETFFVNASNITGATASDPQGQGTIQNDDITLTLIHDIQGAGASSPIVGNSVTVRGIVTGVRSNGFFLQEEDADADGDAATSEGILVFTGGAPPAAAAVTNLVQVTGTVAEFVPGADPLQPPLTELTSPSVALVTPGHPLPAPIPLGPTFPDPAGAFDQLERIEGMRASVAAMTVVGPTLGSVNEPNATASGNGVFYGVVTGIARPFREAGIPAPDPAPSGGGTIPPIPRFDSNPERIRVDSDNLVGAAAIDIGAGGTVSNVVGPLDYTFRTYSISPDPAAAIAAGGPTPTAVSTPTAGEITVAAFNVQRFFDDVDDPSIGEPVLTPAAYGNRLKKASLAIRDYLKTPDILGIVEVENLAALGDLSTRINLDALAAGQPQPLYEPYLVEGNDIGGIDVGFLVKKALVDNVESRVEVVSVTQVNAGELFTNPDLSTELLNDRPSLVLDAVVHHPSGETFPLVVIVNHLRSLNGANSEQAGTNGWATTGARVRAKRQKQAESLASVVQARQLADPLENILLVGDFNFFEVNDGLTHGMGVVRGNPVPDDQTAVPGDGIDLVSPNLNLLQEAAADQRYSYIFDGNAQSLDHAIANVALANAATARRIEHPRINADFPETDRNDYSDGNPKRLADHDPLVTFFTIGSFSSTIFNDGFETGDTVRWSSTVSGF